MYVKTNAGTDAGIAATTSRGTIVVVYLNEFTDNAAPACTLSRSLLRLSSDSLYVD